MAHAARARKLRALIAMGKKVGDLLTSRRACARGVGLHQWPVGAELVEELDGVRASANHWIRRDDAGSTEALRPTDAIRS